MAQLERLSFTIDKPLLRRMEQLLRRGRYGNRSEFIRGLVRARVVQEEWEENEEAVGTITLVYNHEVRRLTDKLTTLQHEHYHAILATTHVHLDHDVCAEMIMVRGRARVITEIAEQLRQQKGVLHAAVSMSSTGKHLA